MMCNRRPQGNRYGRFLVAAVLLGAMNWCASQASAVLLYSNPSATGAGFAGSPADNFNIILDDVLVPENLNLSSQPLGITKVTFGILRTPGAAAVNVTGYWANLTTPPTAADFPGVVSPINSLWTISLPAYAGATTGVETVTFYNNGNFLFTVNPIFNDPAILPDVYGEFAVGLQFPTIVAGNSWALADIDDPQFQANSNFAYGLQNAAATAEVLPEFTQGDFQVFYMQIEGSPVPEPTSAVMLGAGLVAVMARRRKV